MEEPTDNNSAVESNQKVKLGEKTNVCEHCGWAFRDASTLVLHLKVHVQGQTQGPYPPLACSSDMNTVIECHECGKRFVSRAAFSNHVKVHNPSLRFVRRPAPASIPVSVRPLTPYQLMPPYQTLVEPEEQAADQTRVYCFGCSGYVGSERLWEHLEKHAKALVQVCDDTVKTLNSFEVRLLPDDKSEVKFKSL